MTGLGPAGDRGTLEDVERAYVLKVLEECGWRIEGEGGAARRLGLHPNTLRNRMRKLGLRRPRPSEREIEAGGRSAEDPS
jgi:transcriptional regulator with GAF, ATPase, and Fis domain